MSNRLVRIAVLVAALAGLAAGGFVVADAERSLQTAQRAHAAFDEQASAVLADMGNLREAQQAYVADGQSTDNWLGQSAAAFAAVDRGMAALTADASSLDGRTAIKAAAGALEDFRKLDTRARQYVKSNQNLMASDVIFSESRVASHSASQQVATARSSEAAASAAAVDGLRWRQIYAAAGAAGLLGLAVLLLTPVPEKEVDVLTAMRALTEAGPKDPRRAEPALAPATGSSGAFDDVPHFEAVRLFTGTRPKAAIETASAPAETAPALPTIPEAPVAPDVDLTLAARVCADMARVLDAGDLITLLGRAARVLDAPGLVVWVADRDGHSLHPLMTHGYAPSVVARIGTIPTDADNATATAWRSGEVGMVSPEAGSSAALVAPIVTAEGCVGVLAAEVPGGHETRADVRAMAMIFAAQLATFVTALPAAAAGGQSLAAEA